MDDPVYSADPEQAVRITVLDDLSVIYHRPSGLTHIVDQTVPEILALLRQTPSTARVLLAALARDHDIFADGTATQALQARLDELCALGLVVAT